MKIKEMETLTIQKVDNVDDHPLSEDQQLHEEIERLDREVQLSLNEAQQFLEFIQQYQSKLIAMEARLLEIRSLIEKGLFNRSLDIELGTLINRLQKLVDPKLKKKIINKLQVIQNFQEYASEREEQLEWQMIRSRLNHFTKLLH